MKKETIVRFIKTQHLSWAGHVGGMEPNRAPKTMTYWKPEHEDKRENHKNVTTWRREPKDRSKWQSVPL